MNRYRLSLILAGLMITGSAKAFNLEVSLFQIFFFPDKYIGDEITVTGFYHSNYIYISRQAARIDDTASALYVIGTGGFFDYCENAYVRIAGKLVPDTPEGLGMNLRLKSIYSLERKVYCNASWENEPGSVKVE